MANHVDELAEISKIKKSGKPDTKQHVFAKGGWDYRVAYYEDFKGNKYRLIVSVGKNGKINTVYNVGNIQKRRNTTKVNGPSSPEGGAQKVSGVLNTKLPQKESGVNNNIRQNSKNNTTTMYEAFREAGIDPKTFSNDEQPSYSTGSKGSDKNRNENMTEVAKKYNAIIEEHGAIPKGEKPARDISVPKKSSKTEYVSNFARTMLEAGATYHQKHMPPTK